MKDTIGRENRKLTDKNCEACGNTFRPLRAASRFCSRPCMWSRNGGKNKKQVSLRKNAKGYIVGKMWLPNGSQIHFRQHRLIMEGIIGRLLREDEDVHHINRIKDDNRPENLELISHGNHTQKTNSERTYRKGYKMKLTQQEREARSLRAIAKGLSTLGREAIAKAKRK